MKIIYLHIGSHKTGTTALQSFLHENKDLLKEQGFLYPRIGYDKPLPHHVILRPIITPSENDYVWDIPGTEYITEEEDLYKAISLECDKLKISKVILSTELLFFDDLLLKNLRKKRNAAEYIRNLFPDSKIIPIVYLRNQVDLIESLYIEAVKGAHTCFENSFSEYKKENEDRLYYTKYLKPWTDEFGDDVIIKCYERCVENHGIEKDFLSILGISDKSIEFKVPDRVEQNPSLTLGGVELLRQFNKINNKRRQGAKYSFPYDLKLMKEKGLLGKSYYFSHDEARLFLEKFT